jgi:hypothetical protein
MGTVPSQNSEENMNEIGGSLLSKHARKNISAELYYAMTYKNSVNSEIEAKAYAENNGGENVLLYALGKFNNRLDRILSSEMNNAKVLHAIEAAFRQYEVFGIGEAANSAIDKKLKSDDDEVSISRFPELRDVLADTQDKFNDCISHLDKLVGAGIDEGNAEKVVHMFIELKMLSIENKIARGIGVQGEEGIEDEFREIDEDIMFVEIERVVEDVKKIKDFDLTEKIILRVIQVAIDMRKYNYANDLNKFLIKQREELDDFGTNDAHRLQRIFDLMLNRVKIYLLANINYEPVAELMNDLNYIIDVKSCDLELHKKTSVIVGRLGKGSLVDLQGVGLDHVVEKVEEAKVLRDLLKKRGFTQVSIKEAGESVKEAV